MNESSRNFLNANRHHYDLLIRAQYVKHLDISVREELLAVIRREFAPGYLSNNWCPECVANMIRFAYEQYDKWLAAQPVPDGG